MCWEGLWRIWVLCDSPPTYFNFSNILFFPSHSFIHPYMKPFTYLPILMVNHPHITINPFINPSTHHFINISIYSSVHSTYPLTYPFTHPHGLYECQSELIIGVSLYLPTHYEGKTPTHPPRRRKCVTWRISIFHFRGGDVWIRGRKERRKEGCCVPGRYGAHAKKWWIDEPQEKRKLYKKGNDGRGMEKKGSTGKMCDAKWVSWN